MGYKKNVTAFVLVLAPFLLTCTKPAAKSQRSTNSNQPVSKILLPEFSIKNTLGVVRLDYQTIESKVRFFNTDGSLWLEFPVTSDQVEHKSFRPFSQKLDYALLVLKCVSEDATQFEVIVDESSGLKKFIKKSDQLFKFQRWEDHILSLFSVDFNKTENPLRNAPAETAPSIQVPLQVFFHPVEIQGDWLKVRVEDADGGKPQVKGNGWVKWRAGDSLVIDFFYFA